MSPHFSLSPRARLVAVIATLAIAVAACGSNDDTPEASGTQASLEAHLEARRQALINSDAEAIAELQAGDCDFTVDEVREGLEQVNGLTLAFMGTTMSDLVNDLELTVTSFDEANATGEVVSTYVGDDPALAEGTDDSPTTYRFVDGYWSSDSECIGPDDGLGFSSGGEDDPGEAEPFEGDLRPADEVTAEEDRANATPAAIGETLTLDSGVTVVVSAIELNPDDDPDDEFDPPIMVTLRAENRTGEDQSTPSVELLCAGIAESGGWGFESDYESTSELPNGSFEEGTIYLTTPFDADGECGDPVVRVSDSFTITFGDEVSTTFDLPAPAFS